MDENDRPWRGVHVSSLQTSFNHYQYPKLIPGQNEHAILVKLPVVVGQLPESYPSITNFRDCWDQYHVKLPCSAKNVTRNNEPRWDIIREELTRVSSSRELEKAILNYNNRYSEKWNFSALHSFFDEVLEEEETQTFFETLFPKIVDLALRLPELVTGGIPLLKHGCKRSVSLSQMQIASLLANAFLCTFPHRNWSGTNGEYSNYPDINFNRLFQCEGCSRVKTAHEKLKCILNYFRRVTISAPTGIVTFSRQYVPSNSIPDWFKSNRKLPRLYVSSSGTIEDDGFGLFQVDFANKFVGGGVIGAGCVQEEIRFVVCPELIISRLFTEALGENEALIVIGCERFNCYRGYGNTFEWEGNYIDGTPMDAYGRKYCTLVALDALCYQSNPNAQYRLRNIGRDLNKAYVGFSWGSSRKKEELCAIATGNWGCGVFAGDPQLKSIMQLLAAGQVERDLAYFTFGDTNLRDSMVNLHEFLSQNAVTVGKVCRLLISYSNERMYEKMYLFEYLRMNVLEEEPSSNEERGSKYFSEKKTLNVSFSTKPATNGNHSFYREKMNSTPTSTMEMDDSNWNSGISKSSDKLSEPSPRSEVDTQEERMKRDELRRMSGFYDKTNISSPRSDFEGLSKMKNSFQKKSPEEPRPEINIGLEKLETNISTQLSINAEEDINSSLEDEPEPNEISSESVGCSHQKNGIEVDNVAESSFTKFEEENGITKVEEEEIASIEEPTIPSSSDSSPPTLSSPVTPSRSALGPLSQLSARKPKKPTTSKNKISKENSSQKRKLPDYFKVVDGSSKKNA